MPGEGEVKGFLWVLEAAGEHRRDLYVHVAMGATQLGPVSLPGGPGAAGFPPFSTQP